MGMVTLDTIWIHLGSDYSTSIQLSTETMAEKTAGYAKVRRFAGGRLVSIGQSGDRSTYTLRGTLVTRSDVDFLRDLADGDTLVIRDPYARVIWGVLDGGVSISETGKASSTTRVAAVGFTLHEITETQEV
jgi:hypothetical protein